MSRKSFSLVLLSSCFFLHYFFVFKFCAIWASETLFFTEICLYTFYLSSYFEDGKCTFISIEILSFASIYLCRFSRTQVVPKHLILQKQNMKIGGRLSNRTRKEWKCICINKLIKSKKCDQTSNFRFFNFPRCFIHSLCSKSICDSIKTNALCELKRWSVWILPTIWQR